MVKQAWKPIERYFDLDGISERLRNREAFAAFIKTFGWTQYMFHPIVMDFQKLLDGRDDYNEEKRGAVGFDRLPDITFERLSLMEAFENALDPPKAFPDSKLHMQALILILCHSEGRILRQSDLSHGKSVQDRLRMLPWLLPEAQKRNRLQSDISVIGYCEGCSETIAEHKIIIPFLYPPLRSLDHVPVIFLDQPPGPAWFH